MKKSATKSQTIVLLRVGIGMFLVGALVLLGNVIFDRNRVIPPLNEQEEELFTMLNLKPELAVKYKKYGDIVLREKKEAIPNGSSVLTTYFYITNTKGDLSPIGDKRYQTGRNGFRSWSWRRIVGRGENPVFWTKYSNVVNYSEGNMYAGRESDPRWGVVTNRLMEIAAKNMVNVRFHDGEVNVEDSKEVAKIARAVAALRNVQAINNDIARRVKAALQEDKKAQGACPNDTFLLAHTENVNEGYFISSVLGGASAHGKYSIDQLQQLHRYRINSEGLVSGVEVVPHIVGGYTLTDIRACSLYE